MSNCIQFSLVVHLPSISYFLPVLLFLVSLFFIVQRTIRSPKVEGEQTIVLLTARIDLRAQKALLLLQHRYHQ